MPRPARADWYWEESEPRMQGHPATNVLAGTHFIRYPHAVGSNIEAAYRAFAAGTGSRIYGLPAHNSLWTAQDDGQGGGANYIHQTTRDISIAPNADYHVDFGAMQQTKIDTGFIRCGDRFR
jgi:hypothetical protein